MLFDILIQNGRVIDGTGNPWFKANVAINDGKIIGVGKFIGEDAQKIINAEELVVAPGFIDPHSHTDSSILFNNKAENPIQQGVTTEFIGNCGDSLFPVTEKNRAVLHRRITRRCQLDLTDVDVDWTSLSGFNERLNSIGVGTNLVNFVGHNTVRSAVMGLEGEGGEREVPSSEEMEKMQQYIVQAMEEGCWGLTTGLVYAPGCNSKTSEVVELARIVAEFGGIYMSHIRGGYVDDSGLKEFIHIAEKASLKSIASHHHGRFLAVPRTDQSGLVGISAEDSLILMKNARKRGVAIYLDVIPFNDFGLGSLVRLIYSGKIWDENGKLFPYEKAFKLLKDPENRKRIEKNVRKSQEKHLDEEKRSLWDSKLIISSIKFPEYVGWTLAEVAEKRGVDPSTSVIDVCLEDEGNTYWGSWHVERDLRGLMIDPWCMFSTDGSAIAGRLKRKTLAGTPRPAGLGAFTKVLGLYVREEELFTLEEAIRKMTSLPAQVAGIKDRGRIAEGMWADVTVFNPHTVSHRTTYAEPRQYSVGIEYVIVNGEVALNKGSFTGTLAGKILEHKPKK